MVKIVIAGAALAGLVLVADPGTGLAQNRGDREEFYCVYPRGGLAPDAGPYPCTRNPHYVGVRRLTTFCSGGKCEEQVNFAVVPAPQPSAAPGPRAAGAPVMQPLPVTTIEQAP